ncbi:MAG: LysR substrate-binding domain-containing protein, partial [Janthinobacterium lividum]
IGVRLFNRTSRVLRLTQEGERFLDAAQRVLDALAAAEESVGDSRVEVSGVLRINSALVHAHFLLAPLLPEFLARNPRLRAEVILSGAPVDLFENQIDISIQSGHVPDSSLVARRIASGRWIICASPEYLARAGTPETPEQLHTHNCLNFLPDSQRSIWSFKNGASSTKMEVKGSVGSNSAELLHSLALSGMGIARLLDFHVAGDVRSGRLVQVLEEFQTELIDPVYAIYPSKRHLNARVKALLEFLQERLGAEHGVF